MPTVNQHIAATPAAVFAALAEGWYYSDWVVGTSHVRAVDDHWPQAGSRLHHATGIWPVVFRDETHVESCEPDVQLVMTARGRPFGEALVTLTLRPAGTGTDVELAESPVSGPGKWLHNPLTERLLRRRNVESLARLTVLVERRTSA